MGQAMKRVLLKLSGEALGNPGTTALDPRAATQLATQIKEVHELGAEVAVVNGLCLSDALERIGLETRVQTAVPINSVAEPYIRRRAMRHLEKRRVVVFTGGTGNPYFTTDTAAALRATEIGADCLLKATKVDGVYDKDPKVHADAVRFDALSYDDVLERKLKVMDATAITLCSENAMPIVVTNFFEPGNLVKVVQGDTTVGTWVR